MKTVTAIMPTRGRIEWSRQAIDCFLAQTYPEKRLIIIDDEDDRAFPNGIDHQLITYRRENIRYNIPWKMNQGSAMADGEIIAKWDSDDWYAPSRISDQVARLEQTGKGLTGYRTCLFHEPATDRVYEYRIRAAWALGTSLTFLRSWWHGHKFLENKVIGSDNAFCRAACEAGQLDSVEGGQAVVARIHDGNTSHKRRAHLDQHYYFPMTLDNLPAEYLALQPVRA